MRTPQQVEEIGKERPWWRRFTPSLAFQATPLSNSLVLALGRLIPSCVGRELRSPGRRNPAPGEITDRRILKKDEAGVASDRASRSLALAQGASWTIELRLRL